ncbi:MAG TPA: 16S rRNA (cytidine(1402)-2'-O)-methyltransferase [Jatrophihabitantaceae bacterium]|jgi:16S rRNA (cytidine1402-2'-O)-methyltransferase
MAQVPAGEHGEDGAGDRGGRLVLAATPLGDPGDASARLRAALADAPVIAAEDTRRLRRLCAALGVSPAGRIVSYYDQNEAARVPQLLASLDAGSDVLVVTDAGMPSVSDPGFRLVTAAIDAGHPVTVLPGPSAVLAALAVSGLPVDRFCFDGFLPRRGAERRRYLAGLAGEGRTLVLFEAPHRLAAALADLATAFGPTRRAAVCRELTKTYEEVRRAPLGELAQWAASGEVRGEITLVIAGADRADVEVPGPAELASLVAQHEAGGSTRKDAIATVAREAGVPKRTVYGAVVSTKET